MNDIGLMFKLFVLSASSSAIPRWWEIDDFPYSMLVAVAHTKYCNNDIWTGTWLFKKWYVFVKITLSPTLDGKDNYGVYLQ